MASEEADAKLTNLFTKLQDLVANGQGVSKKAVRVVEDSKFCCLRMHCHTPSLLLPIYPHLELTPPLYAPPPSPPGVSRFPCRHNVSCSVSPVCSPCAVLKLAPADADALSAKAVALVKQEKFGDTLVFLKAHPTIAADLNFEKAYSLYRLGRFDEVHRRFLLLRCTDVRATRPCMWPSCMCCRDQRVSVPCSSQLCASVRKVATVQAAVTITSCGHCLWRSATGKYAE